VPHQAVLESPIGCPQQHAAGQRQVAVEPGVPQAAAVRLHIDHQEGLLLALGHRLQLQARAATGLGLGLGLEGHSGRQGASTLLT